MGPQIDKVFFLCSISCRSEYISFTKSHHETNKKKKAHNHFEKTHFLELKRGCLLTYSLIKKQTMLKTKIIHAIPLLLGLPIVTLGEVFCGLNSPDEIDLDYDESKVGTCICIR